MSNNDAENADDELPGRSRLAKRLLDGVLAFKLFRF
jgi:hypothetical protein